jgi:RNA polymerase sigma-70 factor (ECF subfamily)
MSTAKGVSTHSTVIKEWVQLYADGMYAWAYYKTSNGPLAEDLVQDTFLAALQSFDKFKQESQPKTWLFSILNNKIVDHYRKQFRNPVINTGGEDDTLAFYFDSEGGGWREETRPQEWSTGDTNLLDDNEFRNVLQHCMKLLPGNWFTALTLKYLEQKDGKAICKDLGITPSNFWQILHRAKLQLRACLEQQWFKK